MKIRLLLPVLLLILYSVSVAAQVAGPAENPQVIQRTVEILGKYESDAAQAISENDRDSFKEVVKNVFKFHDLAPARYKSVIVDYDKQIELLVAENKLKAVLRNGLQKFEIPKETEDFDITSAMIRLIREPLHIVPENKPGFPTRAVAIYGGGGLAVVLIALAVAFRKRLGGFFRNMRRKRGPLESQADIEHFAASADKNVQSWEEMMEAMQK